LDFTPFHQLKIILQLDVSELQLQARERERERIREKDKLERNPKLERTPTYGVCSVKIIRENTLVLY